MLYLAYCSVGRILYTLSHYLNILQCFHRLWATWPTTGWPCMKMWTLTLWGKLCGTTSTVCTGYGKYHTLLEIEKVKLFYVSAKSDFLSLYLCSYDDYDYGSVNVLLERSMKVFVKTMACHPEQTTARVYHAFWRHFRHSEKVRTSSNTHLTRPLEPQWMNHLTFSQAVSFWYLRDKEWIIWHFSVLKCHYWSTLWITDRTFECVTY